MDASQESQHADKALAFGRIIEEQCIHPVYQPVFELHNGRLIGWEAFARGPEESPLQMPKELFSFSEAAGACLELDHLCRSMAVISAAGLPPDQRLFINLHSQSLLDPGFKLAQFLRLVAEKGLETYQIVFEASEGGLAATEATAILAEAFSTFHDNGISLAISNVGAQGACLSILSRLRPDLIKLDRCLVENIDNDAAARLTTENLLLLSEKIGALMIAEGIERKEELQTLSELGFYGGQGYFLAEPCHKPGSVGPRNLPDSHARSEQKIDWREASPIRNLVKSATLVDHKTPISEVKKKIGEESPMKSVVVTQSGMPVGLVMRYSLDSHLSSLYGPSLYYHRPVSMIMDGRPLIAPGRELVEAVAKKAMNREAEHVYDDIIVVEDGRLLGTVSVQNMMDALAKLQLELAKGANPLTGLPGNVMIEMEITKRKTKKIHSSFLYLDLDNFKVYNDVYGFRQGDGTLKMTAQVIKQAVTEEGGPSDFIGHIGGDDFVIITTPRNATAVASRITDLFSAEIPAMYNDFDRERGYIKGVSRDGREGRFPFISVSVAIIDCTFEYPLSMEELSHRAANVKKYAKSKPGNVHVRDRRPPLGSLPKDPLA
jgi:diguanylate cyclase (GGDEF)-like protein